MSLAILSEVEFSDASAQRSGPACKENQFQRTHVHSMIIKVLPSRKRCRNSQDLSLYQQSPLDVVLSVHVENVTGSEASHISATHENAYLPIDPGPSFNSFKGY
jgi:hypothetical protein